MNRLETDLDPLLQELEESLEGPAVVAIGGGHGLAQALLAIQRYADEITAVVGVSDDGGSSGRLAPAYGLPAPGDLRRCLLALTPNPSAWRELFEYRFDRGDIAGHALGNLILTALTDLEGDFETALRVAELYLGAAGSVVPVATMALSLEATVDGRAVVGQAEISVTPGPVEAIRVSPESAEANPRAIAAILAADQVVLGPGSLYTSVIAPLLVPGMADAVNRSEATFVYICNLITQDAETLAMDAMAHVKALMDLAGTRWPDAIVANESAFDVSPPLQPVRVDTEQLSVHGSRVVCGEFADPTAAWPAHDPVELGKALGRLATE